MPVKIVPVPVTARGFVCFKMEVSQMGIKTRNNELKYAVSGKEVRR